MKTKLLAIMTLTAAMSNSIATETKRVAFESQGTTLAGVLYLPSDYNEGDRLPGVVVTGAWTSVKEQMPSVYAAALAERGYAALIFDFRGWGESPDAFSYLEDPKRKTDDIVAAFEYLASRPEVDNLRIGGLGICASSGYMSDAALRSARVSSLALVAPWLHDAEIVEAVYGGKEGVAQLIATGRAAAASSEPVYIEAASATNEKSLMYQAPYYTETDRGLIDAYDNQFNVASWEPWLAYDALITAPKLEKPALLVHSEAAAIPQGAKRYVDLMGENADVKWLDNVVQFDFYDDPEVVETAASAVADHFGRTLRAENSDTGRKDDAALKTIVESVAVLADRGEFDALEALYADEIEVDYTSLAGGEVETKSPQALMSEWAAVLPGFDRTRHALSDIEASIDGDQAVATAKVVADHFVDGLFWRARGEYRYRFVNENGSWKIVSHVFTLADEAGTRDVFGPAMERAAKNPPAYLLRQKTKQAVRDFLTSLETKDMEAFASVWAEDAVQHMPYAPDGFPERVVGKAAILEHYSNWPENSGKADFTSNLVFYPMVDPELVFVEFKGDAEIIPTNRRYRQSYGGLFHVENGAIKLFREYFNPGPFVYAFGIEE